MKKIFILAAALATMASCTKNASLEVAPIAEDNAIGFSAYTGTAATKGTIETSEGIIGKTDGGNWVAGPGIGVFAFYQPGIGTSTQNFNSTKFAAPDFMYNQKVYCKTAENKWEYSPVKYWPNNENDQISFFAYAPYDENTSWEDLGFKTDAIASKLTASFPIYGEKTSMKDYLFATPALNKSKQKVAVSPATSSADLITFAFNHITSRVAINIGAIVDEKAEAETKPQAFPALEEDGTGTLITVESIVLKDVAESIDYTYTFGATPAEKFEPSGSQDITLTSSDFQNNTSDKWVMPDEDATEMPWLPLLAEEDEKTGYLFIAPQKLTDKKLVITYKVETTDADHPENNSTITNVIEKPIRVEFEKGKAYTLNLLIGMKTVELSASVSAWDEPESSSKIDVPANE